MQIGDLVTIDPDAGIASWNAWQLAPPEIAKLLVPRGTIAINKATNTINLKQDQLSNALCEVVQRNDKAYVYLYLICYDAFTEIYAGWVKELK